MIQQIVAGKPSYGYRRVAVLLDRELKTLEKLHVNHKRIYRIMRENQLLLQKHTCKPTRTHDGEIVTLKSNLRWCSDSFEIRVWSGEKVQVAFSFDFCDREVMSYVATAGVGAITGEMISDLLTESMEHRFGSIQRLPNAIEWLSDNGPPYTAHETRNFGASLGLIVCNMPPYSPESNEMAEAFVKTFKQDYAYLNQLENAEVVFNQLPGWFEDYNEKAPHKGLKMKSPREFRRLNLAG